KLRMSAAVESVAIAHLDDPDPEVVRTAAETLGFYGSRAAQLPLRVHFERWHGVWQGRDADLRYTMATKNPNAPQGMVEWAFLRALSQGAAWLAAPADLKELKALCVTDNCRRQTENMLLGAEEPAIRIIRVDDPYQSSIFVAQ